MSAFGCDGERTLCSADAAGVGRWMSGLEGVHARVVERTRVVRRQHSAIDVEQRQRGTKHPQGGLACGNDEAWTLFWRDLRKRRPDQRAGGDGVDTRPQDAQRVVT
jgi:hypothetical protein